MPHLRSPEKQKQRELAREMKRSGWRLIHSCSWHDRQIGETVNLLTPETVINHISVQYQVALLPSVEQHFKSNAWRGLVLQTAQNIFP